MWSDVVDLRDFYDSRLGQVSRHMIRRGIKTIWPSMKGLSLMGLGYATPYLRQYQGEADRVMGFMPARQGVLPWPAEGPGRVALVDPNELPLPDFSVDRVLLVHAFESSDHLQSMLEEVWRVLTGEGRLLVVVPNRRGIWARLERTPFGWGHPYSASQLSRTLRDHLFVPHQSDRALFLPPTRSHTLLRTAPAWERMGARFFPQVSGVLMMEAGKQIYAVSKQKRGAPARRGRAVLVPLPSTGRTFRQTP